MKVLRIFFVTIWRSRSRGRLFLCLFLGIFQITNAEISLMIGVSGQALIIHATIAGILFGYAAFMAINAFFDQKSVKNFQNGREQKLENHWRRLWRRKALCRG